MKKAVAIVGCDLPCCAVNKLSEDFHVVILPRDNKIAPQVSSHPDMILTAFDSKLFCHESYARDNPNTISEICSLTGLELVPCKGERNAKYPADVAFNVLSLGDKLIGRRDSMALDLLEYDSVNTRQGYAGCTALFAGGHVISADASILKSAGAEGIPTKEISGEGITLFGYDKGFIGGACGVYADTVYICGDPSACPAGRDLMRVCNELGLYLVSLCGGEVIDSGGIKFVPFSIEK